MRRWLVFFLLVVSCNWVDAKPVVPCFFIFGDSLADNGNNNNLNTSARVNYPPYGIDFPDGSSGRFGNGKNVVDFLAEFLGFGHPIPPFATAGGMILLYGVNYASGSAGIRDETGQHLGQNVNLSQQLRNHLITISAISKFMGNNKDNVIKRLNQCLYSVGMGSNDYFNNYFLPQHYPTSKLFTPDQYAQVLIDQYSTQIKTLYDYGARKIVINGLANLGCIPHIIAKYGTANGSPCVDQINEASFFFNQKLVDLVQQLNKALPGAKFVFVNSSEMSKANPSSAGFTNSTSGCCKTREDGQCIANDYESVCPNRREFVFWDSFHPTEASNAMVAAVIYNTSDLNLIFPCNIRTLSLAA